jgi:hypothetical protein
MMRKKGGRKTYQSIGDGMRPRRWTFLVFSIQLPPFLLRVSVSGASCTIGRHFDVRGRHGAPYP